MNLIQKIVIVQKAQEELEIKSRVYCKNCEFCSKQWHFCPPFSPEYKHPDFLCLAKGTAKVDPVLGIQYFYPDCAKKNANLHCSDFTSKSFLKKIFGSGI